MTTYYGFMVCEFDGDIENLQTEADYKPSTERCGFSYAKWFIDKNKRDKCQEYTAQQIKRMQELAQ